MPHARAISFVPGDFVIQGVLGGQPVAPEDIAGVLARLTAPLGVFATLGNHDWWLDGERVRKALETAGIQVIDNRALPLASADGRLWLAGIGDDMTGHARPDAAFAGVPADARLIVIMHDPANAAALPPQTVVAFAGHTHGGQVRLPLIGALITPGRAPRRHSWGWIPDAPAPTWVTAGIGTSVPHSLQLPAGNRRLACRRQARLMRGWGFLAAAPMAGKPTLTSGRD